MQVNNSSTTIKRSSDRHSNETMDLFHFASTVPRSESPLEYRAKRREKVEAAPKMQPDPEWIRGRCPECGEPLISNMYYAAGRGYLIIWECWSGMSENPTCEYRLEL